ncbi:MAG TPA: helix-turn-helix transcriptional regulator [Solirubrobacteraceae bacterium]|jgi:transcriptional regulator with XRE-family HTH domain|nr:helix-turn-helix transcriptional regulator [Solirubrobacteraceae bacterium]
MPSSRSVDQVLASALRMRREARGATQEEVAQAAGVTTGTFGLIERGQVNPGWMTVKRIAKALDTPLAELAMLTEVNRVLGGIAETETVSDPLQRPVHLTTDRWHHILAGHPEMFPYLDDVLRAIRAPTKHIRLARPSQDWFYLEGIGPSDWLKVVVAYDEHSIGSVKTAFARGTTP